MANGKNVNEKLEIPLGGEKRIFIYVQMYDGKKLHVNVYFYSAKPYSSDMDNMTEKFAMSFTIII